jgi:hypothetical protein
MSDDAQAQAEMPLASRHRRWALSINKLKEPNGSF